MDVNPLWITVGASIVLPALSSWVAYKQASRANAVDERRVDVEMVGAVATILGPLRSELAQVRSELTDTARQLRAIRKAVEAHLLTCPESEDLARRIDAV